jgi:hypothetical protein
MDPVKPASTQDSDMIGTVACEPGVQDLGLYQLFGLDSTTQSIVGFEVYNEQGYTIASVHVVETTTEEFARLGGFDGIAAQHGGHLPVSKYVLEGGRVSIGDFIDKHFKRFHIVAANRHDAFLLTVARRYDQDENGDWVAEDD